MVYAGYGVLTNEQARQESVFHHLTQRKTKNEGRSEILVLLNRMGFPGASPPQALFLSTAPCHHSPPPPSCRERHGSGWAEKSH